MHASKLAELAGWLTQASWENIDQEKLPQLLKEKYWKRCLARTERWNKALKMFADDLERMDEQHNPWPAISIVVEEIILSEMLCRIWSSVVCQPQDSGAAKPDKTERVGAISHSLLIGHIEARNRAFALLLNAPFWARPTAERLSQLSNRVERWTDLLLGYLPHQQVCRTFAFSEKRLADFRHHHHASSREDSESSHSFLVRSLVEEISDCCSRFPANPELNQSIVASILGCFESDPFSNSLPSDTWLLQLDSRHENVTELAAQLAETDSDAF